MIACPATRIGLQDQVAKRNLCPVAFGRLPSCFDGLLQIERWCQQKLAHATCVKIKFG